MRSSTTRAAVLAALAIALGACGSTEPTDPSAGFRFDTYAGTYVGSVTTTTRIVGQPEETTVRPLAITIRGGASPTVTFAQSAAPGTTAALPPSTGVGSYTAAGATLTFPEEPPLVLTINPAGQISGSGGVSVLGSTVAFTAEGRFGTSEVRIVMTAEASQDLATAPRGSTQTVTLLATR